MGVVMFPVRYEKNVREHTLLQSTLQSVVYTVVNIVFMQLQCGGYAA